MNDLRKYILAFIILLLTYGELNAQGKYKFGVGGNFIESPDVFDFESYLAFSFHLGYTLVRVSGLSVGWENATSLSGNQDKNNPKSGFTTAFPIVIQYEFKRPVFCLGAGPAFMAQSNYDHSVGGLCMDLMAGIGWKQKPNYDGCIPETDLRFSYFKNIHPHYDMAMISLILFVRGM